MNEKPRIFEIKTFRHVHCACIAYCAYLVATHPPTMLIFATSHVSVDLKWLRLQVALLRAGAAMSAVNKIAMLRKQARREGSGQAEACFELGRAISQWSWRS